MVVGICIECRVFYCVYFKGVDYLYYGGGFYVFWYYGLFFIFYGNGKLWFVFVVFG